MPKLNNCQLPGCREKCREKFCCKEHHNLFRCEQKKKERAAIKAAKIVICEYCHNRIDDPHSNQVFHKGECVEKGYSIRRVKFYRDRRHNSKSRVVKTCECGRQFETSSTNTRRKYCQISECTNERQRRIKHERIEAGTWIEKKPKVDPPKKKEDPYKIEWVTIAAICPTCQTPHEQEVVKGSSKWIYCDAHQYLRSRADIMDTKIILNSFVEY